MRKSRIPSPARSQGTITPRRKKSRGSRSLCSPALSTASGRLTSLVDQFKDKNVESFALSPLTSRSVLNDNTDIEEPRRRSWWKKLGENSQSAMEVLEDNKVPETNNMIEDLIDIEVLSQEKKNYTLDLPESSDNESINSIVLPQRRLFTQKDNQPQKKFGQLMDNRESLAKLNKTNTANADKTVNVGTRELFQNIKRSKPVFPAALLQMSPNKTAADKTKENILIEPKPQVRNIFGNRPANKKRKNIFANFIASDSEEEIPEIQPRVFGFQKKPEQRRVSTVSKGTENSPTSSITTDMDFDGWKHLPSSTLVENQLEDMVTGNTPVKRPRLSKLSEAKESETGINTIRTDTTADKTKQSNKSVSSKSKSKTSPDIKNKTLDNSRITRSISKNTSKSEDNDYNAKGNKSLSKTTKDKSLNINAPVLDETQKQNVSKSKSINKSRTQNSSKIRDKEFEANANNAAEDVTNNEIGNNDKSSKKVISKIPVAIRNQKEEENVNIVEQTEDEDENNYTLRYEDDENELVEKEIPSNIKRSHKDHSENQNGTVIEKFSKHPESNKLMHNATNLEHKIVEESIESEQNEHHSADDNVDGKLEQAQEHQNEEIHKEVSLTNENEDKLNENDGNVSKINKSKQKLMRKEENENSRSQDKETGTIQDLNYKMNEENLIENTVKVVSKIQEDENEDAGIQGVKNLEIEEADLSQEMEDADENEQDTEKADESQATENEADKSEEVETEADVSQEVDENQEDEEEAYESQEDEKVNESEEVEDADESQEVDDNQEDDEEANDSQEVEDADESQEVEDADESQEVEEEAYVSQEVAEDESDEEENDEQEHVQDNEDSTNGTRENEASDAEVNANEEVEYDQEMNDSDEADKAIASDNDMSEQDDSADEMEVDDDNQQETNDNVDQIETHENQKDKLNEEQNDVEPSAEEIEESPNVTHDTTGRNRKKDYSNKSPEVILHDKTKQMDSFTARGRNTSIRKTKSMIKNLNIRPSLAPARDSLGFSDGTRDSSAEGSGWDSHRTTRKTLRQTFGKDFTPRKSLRALVMEKSAKRQTEHLDLHSETVKNPQANSTELPEISNRDDIENIEVSDHEISRRTRQTTLESYLQKIKQQNIEKKIKMEETVRNSLKSTTRDPLSLFKVPTKPAPRRTKPAQNKPKKQINSVIPFDELPSEVIQDLKYKPPKRFQPTNASWITKRLYKFLETKLEPKYDYKARVRAEKLVETIYYFAKNLRRHDVAPTDAVEVLKHELARLDVVATHFEFYQFFHDFMPREVRVKVVPDIVNKIPLPRHGVFSNILREYTVQG